MPAISHRRRGTSILRLFFIAINSTKPFFPASLRFRQADSAVFLPHRFPSFIYKRSLRFRFPLFRSHTYGAFESLCSARHPNDINEEVLTFMKKNPIGKYLLQNWYYYVFAFGSMALKCLSRYARAACHAAHRG